MTFDCEINYDLSYVGQPVYKCGDKQYYVSSGFS